MLKTLILTALMAAAGVFSAAADDIPHEPCIDIDGMPSKVIVMPGMAKGNARLENPVWMGDDRIRWIRMVHPRLVPGGEWIPLTFSFTPAESGEIMVWLRSNQVFGADKKTVPTWVEYRNLSITGGVPAVNGFRSADKGGKNGWIFNSPENLVNNGRKDTVKVWHDSAVFHRINVLGGQEVTVKAEARFNAK